ncbi:protein-tyrosine phosphatase-like protein [Mycena floridula]|nr:protein-tyrosine phosphatase-like protein [Mycena floridula]
MLAFHAPKWQTSLLATTVHRNSGLRLGCASAITPRLFLSDLFTARDASLLEKHGITHVISAIEMGDIGLPESILENNKLHICIADNPDSDLLSHFDVTTEFIRAALAENETNKVLVHCFQGISRSATIVCAYLVATDGLEAIKSIEFVQRKRGIVSPNNGFRRQLVEYGTRFVGSRSKEGKRTFKLSEGISERIRHLKTGSND